MTSLFAEHVNIIPDFLAEISDAIIVDGIVYTGDGMEEDNTMDLRVVLPRDFRDPKLRFDLLITANGVVFDTAMYEVFPSIEENKSFMHVGCPISLHIKHPSSSK